MCLGSPTSARLVCPFWQSAPSVPTRRAEQILQLPGTLHWLSTPVRESTSVLAPRGSGQADEPPANGPRTAARRPFHPRPLDANTASRDRKSTRLNSSHPSISYAVFCLKKKK